MTTLQIINQLASEQPEGKDVLNNIIVTTKSIGNQFVNCDLMRSIVTIKFDLEKLNTSGYTLQEVLDGGAGVAHDEVERFVLQKLQEYISARNAHDPTQNNA